jgi:glycosyltransferase involved in cell wall biosynthesis
LRIVIDGRCILPQEDGLGTYARNLIVELRQQGSQHQFFVLVGDEVSAELQHLHAPPRMTLVPLNAPSMKFSQHLRVPVALKTLRPDVYHYLVHDMPSFHRVPSLVTIQDLNFATLPNYYSRHNWLKRKYSLFVAAKGVKRARFIIVPSQATRSEILKKWPSSSDKIRVIPYGVHERYRRAPDNGKLEQVLTKHGLSRKHYFLFVGTDRPHKNLARLVQSFDDLPVTLRGRFQLALVGSHRYGSSAGNTGHANNGVTSLGYVPAEDLPSLYRAAVAVVLPSISEGFGLPALEAMSCGSAVIASKGGALAEVVDKAGLLVDPTSVSSIREAMQELATDTELRANLARCALERSRQYSFTTTAQKSLELYQMAAEGP